MAKKSVETSWESASGWYHRSVGAAGHTYHQSVIFPHLLPFLEGKKEDFGLLDLGCGQGVLSRYLPPHLPYWGIDLSKELICQAQKQAKSKKHHFLVGDVSSPLPIRKTDFSHAVFLLSLQNIEKADQAIQIATDHLQEGGKLFFVLNHPCFRIPRQSGWQIDEKKKLQSRRLDCYSSPLRIPITTHPSQGSVSPATWSFHFSLSDLFSWIQKANLVVTDLQEWYSEKKSTGPKSGMEDRARREFPLFLMLGCCKIRAKSAI